MANPVNPFVVQLEQACKLTSARWAALLRSYQSEWRVELGAYLNKSRQKALWEFIHTQGVAGWLAGSLHTGRVRSRKTSPFTDAIGCLRVFSFANPKDETILVVGADGLSGENQAIFRILALSESNGFRSNDGDLQNHPGKPIKLAGQEAVQPLPLNIGESYPVAELSDTAGVLQVIIDHLCSIYQTDQSSIYLLNGDGKKLSRTSSLHTPDPIMMNVESRLASYVLGTGLPYRTADLHLVPNMEMGQVSVGSALAVPIIREKQVVGVIEIFSDNLDCFAVKDEKLVVMIAGQLAGMLINVDAYFDSRLRVHKLDLVHRVVQHIVGLTDETEIAQLTAELIAEYFGYEFVIIFLPDAARQNLVYVGIGGTMAALIQRGSSFPITQGITGRVFRTGMSYFSNDVSQDPDYCTIAGWVAGSEICVPLRDAGMVIGAINLERSRKESFSETDQILLESLAGILSSVLMSARRYRQLQSKLKQLQAVRETGLDLTTNLDLQVLLRGVVHKTRELVHAKGAEIGLVEEDGQSIQIQTSANPWYDFFGHMIPIGQGIAGQLLLLKQPIRVADYNAWPDRLDLGKPADFKTAAGVPLMLKGQVIGTLVVMDDVPDREFSEEDIQALELIARNIAVAIHNAQLYQELQERIEAQRQAESRLIQSERIATAGRLTASIAHEINNPLQALHNCLYLADRSELSDAERQKYLSMGRNELDRLISTVQRMLDFYRPIGRDRQQVDVNKIVSNAADLVRLQLLSKGIEIQLNLADDLPRVLVVHSQLQQVLLNLILNAMEAMPDGGKITIQTSQFDTVATGSRKSRAKTKPAGVEILVRDTGPGVPAGDRERIFEPFISTKENGIGLGLSVSYGIIQAHGGTLSLLPGEEQGACFRIALPEEKKG